MSASDEPGLFVPPELLAGVFANDVHIFVDPEHVTLDFVRVDPRNPREGVVVARVAVPPSYILRLKAEMEHLR